MLQENLEADRDGRKLSTKYPSTWLGKRRPVFIWMPCQAADADQIARGINAALGGGFMPEDDEEAYRQFRDWVFTAIRPIGQRIAGQPIRVGRVLKRGQKGTGVKLSKEAAQYLPTQLGRVIARARGFSSAAAAGIA